ncbi:MULTISPECIES: chromate efflux transporter [unclassified Janthinobacterium]|uniref:chromate efflux transporter n=1 Tax=unclassified Janthinobacterium TaxID=2610881 RepID=UPI0003499F48|nr:MULTISPECIES: chromate efflux transporter [unclassified Janthinobacterium]MEC5162028.1 chromate transporter [Janthinobacterium sp. CG_S6]
MHARVKRPEPAAAAAAPPEPLAPAAAAPVTLAALCRIFLLVGCTSFGGFMVMIGVTQNAVVERRKLLTAAEVLDGLTLASVLPGPMAINLVAYIGYRLRGAAGAAVCVLAAVAPAFLFMLAFSAVYFRWGHVAALGQVFMGVVPAVAAIILAAGWRMCRASVSDWREAALALAALALALLLPGLRSTFLMLFVAALVGWRCFGSDAAPVRRRAAGAAKAVARAGAAPAPRRALLLLAALPLLGFAPGVLLKLLAAFAGMSLLMFGGGYVFIPMLQQTVVDGYGWVSRRELVDALAMGQLTPGPVAISAAFIGYKVAGVAGAAAAAIGVFAPAALLTVACARLLERLRDSANVKAALRGVRAAVLGMVCAAAVVVGKAAAPQWVSLALFALTFGLLLRYKLEAVWIVPAAGLIGYVVF